MAQGRRGKAGAGRAGSLARGRRIRRQLWGDDEARRLDVIRRFEPKLADWLVREIFGGFYADERLPLANRSLCTIACLLALGRARQLESHIKAALRKDRPAFLMEFLKNFYNYDVTGGTLVSERVLEDNWNVAVSASAIGTVACVDCWIEDFRKNLPKNTVPTLILHGDADASCRRTPRRAGRRSRSRT